MANFILVFGDIRWFFAHVFCEPQPNYVYLFECCTIDITLSACPKGVVRVPSLAVHFFQNILSKKWRELCHLCAVKVWELRHCLVTSECRCVIGFGRSIQRDIILLNVSSSNSFAWHPFRHLRLLLFYVLRVVSMDRLFKTPATGNREKTVSKGIFYFLKWKRKRGCTVSRHEYLQYTIAHKLGKGLTKCNKG